MSATLEMPKADVSSLTELVESWTLEEKEIVFVQLLDEIIRKHEFTGDIPVRGPDGIYRGYFVTPASAREAFEKFGPTLSEEEKNRMLNYTYNSEPTISMEEMLEEVRAIETAARQRQQSPEN